jgi:glucose-6-phosphate dehydrogenase assembly protein OpcA
MSEPFDERVEWRDLPLDTSTLEERLAGCWRQAAESVAGGLLRASSLTLLVPLLEEGLRERVSDMLAQVATQDPCRVILVVQAEAEPRASLAAHLRPASGGRPPIYWEEICLEAPGRALPRALSAAGALALPNLPVQVWWPGDADLAGPFFQRVAEIGDRIIVDSGQFVHPLTGLGQYAERMEDQRGTVSCVDLNWRRLQTWRILLAQFFDAPDDRAFLNYLDSMVVGYERAADGSPRGYAQALLLLAWLASRLGWTVAAERLGRSQDLEELVFDDGGRWVRVELRRTVTTESGASGLTSAELRAMHDGQSGIFSVERNGWQGTSTAQVGEARRELVVHLPPNSDADLLRAELASFGRDRIYEDALGLIRALTQQAATTSPLR